MSQEFENCNTAMNRRSFVKKSLMTSAAAGLVTSLSGASGQSGEIKDEGGKDRKIKIGLIGCGGRGQWLIPLFQEHGGFELHGVADYFAEAANGAGEKFGVDKSRRFSGLSGYKRLLESGIEAVLIEDVPYFYPEQATDAVEAGMHVYMAKPIAVDVPGCLMIQAAGQKATRNKSCFLVDYQLPTQEPMVEIAKRVQEGALGSLAHIASFGMAWQAWPDPPLTANVESRLRKQIWLSDTGLSGDTIVSYDIHIIDALMMLVGKRPVGAYGSAKKLRANPHGDRTDTVSVIYECEQGATWTHITQALNNNFDITSLSASVFGMSATAHIGYGGKVYIRGSEKHYVKTIGSLYNDGVKCNIADFYRNITQGNYENATVQRAVDGTLTAILGREAAGRRCYLSMDDLIKENKKLEVSLEGMKA